MGTNRKDLWLCYTGLGMAVVGGIAFLMAYNGNLDGATMMFAYFLGPTLVIMGLIMAGIYFGRWRRTQKLLSGEDVLAHWKTEGQEAIISTKSALVDGQLYDWGVLGTRLENAHVEQKSFYGSNTSYLKIDYVISRRRRNMLGVYETVADHRNLSIRVPQGMDTTATQVARQIKTSNGKEAE